QAADRREDRSDDRVDQDHDRWEAPQGDFGVGAGDSVREQQADAVDRADDQASDRGRARVGMLEPGEDGAERGEGGEDPVDARRGTEDDADDRAEDERDDQGEEDLRLPTTLAERN